MQNYKAFPKDSSYVRERRINGIIYIRKHPGRLSPDGISHNQQEKSSKLINRSQNA
uniref:Type II toxin-antitoxin system HicA family toxin n=1 Tax=Heterorhabditis bacteriophora TaxID=37862 RepID=A0A1I7WSE8_HETBA